MRLALGQKAPRVLLLHGADASSLEWRYLVPKLNALGLSTVAVDWWSGGWTDRKTILDKLDSRRPEPWTLVQQHLEVSRAAPPSQRGQEKNTRARATLRPDDLAPPLRARRRFGASSSTASR